MDDYPRWDELGIADRLWIAALEAKQARVKARFVQALYEAAEFIEHLNQPTAGHPRAAGYGRDKKKPR